MTNTTPIAAAAVAAAPAIAATVLLFSYEHLAGDAREFDCASIPQDTRLDILKGAVKTYIYNRLNQRHVQFEKSEAFKAWQAYDAAVANDPLQQLVAKPTFDRPTPPDFQKLYEAAISDLTTGNLRKRGEPGTGRKSTVDPLGALVAQTVTREVYESRKQADPAFTFVKARAEVGSDGVAYLRKLIADKVAAGADEAALNSMLETRYLKPARLMLGIDQPKAIKEGVSIL